MTTAPKAPDIDALVIAYHGDQWLPACVEFVQAGQDPDARLVIADNHGNQTVGTLVDGGNIVALDLPGPLGFADANNRALVALGFRTHLVCFLNQDTRSSPGWLQRAVHLFERYPSLGAVTPLMTTYDGRHWDPNFLDCAQAVPTVLEQLARPEEPEELYDVPVVTAAAMVVRTQVLREVGGFDPLYGSYYEDYDLCQRIRAAGYRIAIWTGARVAHYSGSGTQDAQAQQRRQRQLVRNRLIYGVRTAPQGRIISLGRELFVELPRQLARRLLGRPAAKRVGSLLSAYGEALRLLPRLISDERDERLRREALKQLGWCFKEL